MLHPVTGSLTYTIILPIPHSGQGCFPENHYVDTRNLTDDVGTRILWINPDLIAFTSIPCPSQANVLVPLWITMGQRGCYRRTHALKGW